MTTDFDISQLKLGASAPKYDVRTISFGSILADDLPPPPNAIDNSQRVVPWGMLGNDRYGDCVVAGYAHLLMLIAAMLGGKWAASEQEVVSLYLQRTGGVDSGLVILDFLKWAAKNFWNAGGSNKKILAFSSVDPKNMTLMAKAVELCYATVRGIGLPRTAMGQVGSLWDFMPNTQGNGIGSWGWHLTIGPTYNLAAQRTVDVTWGMLQPATFNFWKAYQSEQYAIITEDTPGINRDALESALQQIGQYVGPTPNPTPPPDPKPTPPPSPITVYATKASGIISYSDGKTQTYTVGLAAPRESGRNLWHRIRERLGL